VGLTIGDVIVTTGKKAPTDGLVGWVADNTRLIIGHPLQNIPGRAIGVTTALIAVAYYMNIFATLDLRRMRRTAHSRKLDRTVCAIAPFTARVLPLVAVCAQGLTVFYDPRLWAYTAGIGGLLVSGNNLVWRRVVKIARREF